MKKDAKRIIKITGLVFLTAIIAVSLFSCLGNTKYENGLKLKLSDDGESYYVVGLRNKTVKNIVVPSSCGGKPVTRISEDAFNRCSSIISVVLPDSLTSIGSESFKGCNMLKSINIPKSITLIGSGAFSGCNRLDDVYIEDMSAWCRIRFGDNPLYFAKNIYVGGEQTLDIVVPDGTECVEAYAFASSIIRSITLPADIKSIGSRAFVGCNDLSDITFRGTKAQWEAVEKGVQWDLGINIHIIHCTDGDVTE